MMTVSWCPSPNSGRQGQEGRGQGWREGKTPMTIKAALVPLLSRRLAAASVSQPRRLLEKGWLW